METAKKLLKEAFDLAYDISVNREDVPRMMQMRQKLQAAFAALEKAQKAAVDAGKQKEGETHA